ncbi:stage III sporulation protein SpoIIIAB [Amphibacillus jilinensis]|uniref:stage III sporulation protein SpoIIIAB n=1 Tax=Amphibacillus jilinensis TaxID=1216008 RepID=UPI0004749B0D|nr:stage III sporulation protein SpoIIIAB [Amphibacillus jilinensis]
MNWIGAILLISACSLIGFDHANRLKKRPEQLLLFKNALQIMEAEIIYSQFPISDICLHIANQISKPLDVFFNNIGEQMKNNNQLDNLWKEEIEQLDMSSSLDRKDLDILRQFGATLGHYDLDQQQKQLQLTLLHLDRLLTEAQKNCLLFSKVYRGIGILTGILLALILI